MVLCRFSAFVLVGVSLASLLPAAGARGLDADGCHDATVVGTGTFLGDTARATSDGSSSCGDSNRSTDASMTPPAGGPDIVIGELSSMQQFGRLGPVVGCGVGSPVCNAGDTPLDWFPLEQPNHPFIVANIYRLHDDRLEQIGQSWIKHGFAAAQANACGLGCVPHFNNTRLGVGCSDTYGAATNANRNFLGPRHEVNPWSGAWSYAGSHLERDDGAHDPIEHRLQLHDDDLDPAQHPGAQYLCEMYVVAHDDVDHANSIAWEPVLISGEPGATWSFDLEAIATEPGPAVHAWPGARHTTIGPGPAVDGRVVLSAKVTEREGGLWRYEYAVFNLDLDRSVGSFSVPVPPFTSIGDTGFRAIESHDEPYSNQPWLTQVGDGQLSWSTDPYERNPAANPLRWGTLYNFWFEADTPPEEVGVTLGLYEPGDPASLTGTTWGPRPTLAGDANGDGAVDVDDLIAVITAWGPCPAVCPADLDGNDAVDVDDLLLVIANWTASGVGQQPSAAARDRGIGGSGDGGP